MNTPTKTNGTNGQVASPLLPALRRAPMPSDPRQVPKAFQDMRADWAAGNESRFQRPRSGFVQSGSGADYHNRNEWEYFKTAEIALDMARNDTIVSAIVRRSLQNIFQGGFGLDPQTGDSELDRYLREDFERWFNDPEAFDASGRFNGHELILQAARGEMLAGDSFVLPLADGRVQLIEGYRCRSPNMTSSDGIVLGVQLDQDRRATGYYFIDDDLDPMDSALSTAQPDLYPARDQDGKRQVWHIADPQRYSQTRGMTALAPVFDELGLFGDAKFAQLVKSQMSACVVFFRNQAIGGPGGRPGQKGARTNERQSDGTTRVTEELSPGMEITGRAGETLTGFSPQIMTADELEFSLRVLQQICAAFDLPLISFLMDGRETNFSGWRGAIDQAKIGWRNKQKRYGLQYHQPCYRFRLRWRMAGEPALRRAEERLGDKFFAARVNPPRWTYIEPNKDIIAAGLEKQNLQISPRRQAQERGYNFAEVGRETVEDNQELIIQAIEGAKQVLAKTGVAVDPVRLLYVDGTTGLVEPDVFARAVTVQESDEAAGEVDLNDYATGVRAGVLTPQSDDERHLRGQLGLPAMNEATGESWATGGARRPITLADTAEAEETEQADEADDTPPPEDGQSKAAALPPPIPRVEQYLGPWLMEQRRVRERRVIAERISMDAHRAQITAEDIQQDAGRGYKTTLDGRVAIVELVGPMTKYDSSLLMAMGGSSTLRVRRALRSAAADEQVKRIILLIDSPGGAVAGTGDLADEIYRMRSRIPIVAYIEDVAASAAYWVGSQASRVVISPHAWAGSIGVLHVVTDISEMNGKLGLKTHVVKAGAHKGVGVPGAPVTDDDLAEVQREVDLVYADFVAGVARGRGRSDEEVRTWADGRVHYGRDAVGMGLADEVADWNTFLGEVEQSLLIPLEGVQA